MIKEFLAVGLGGAVGSMLRYSVTLLIRYINVSSIWATFIVNILGSFVIGIIISTCDKGSLNLLLAVGLCGGFTTFSTFSSQTFDMLRSGNYLSGIGYIVLTVVICLLCVWAGMKTASLING